MLVGGEKSGKENTAIGCHEAADIVSAWAVLFLRRCRADMDAKHKLAAGRAAAETRRFMSMGNAV